MPTRFDTPYIPAPRKPKPAVAEVQKPDEVRKTLWAQFLQILADGRQQAADDRRKARKDPAQQQPKQQHIGLRRVLRSPGRRQRAKALKRLDQKVKQLRPKSRTITPHRRMPAR